MSRPAYNPAACDTAVGKNDVSNLPVGIPSASKTGLLNMSAVGISSAVPGTSFESKNSSAALVMSGFNDLVNPGIESALLAVYCSRDDGPIIVSGVLPSRTSIGVTVGAVYGTVVGVITCLGTMAVCGVIVYMLCLGSIKFFGDITSCGLSACCVVAPAFAALNCFAAFAALINEKGIDVRPATMAALPGLLDPLSAAVP